MGGFAAGGLSQVPLEQFRSCSLATVVAGELGIFGVRPEVGARNQGAGSSTLAAGTCTSRITAYSDSGLAVSQQFRNSVGKDTR